ncbi:MAG: hypothetical protein KKH01_05110 [Firmicutes bacterium]|nr:hypothetical protein [Bacillota bacterium]
MKIIKNKKLLLFLFVILLSIGLVSCKEEVIVPIDELPAVNTTLYRTDVLTGVEEVILDELELGFNFFWETANSNLESSGYGLIPDRYNTYTNTAGSVASTASVGFGLTAIPIGIENNWITREQGEERAYYTMVTLQNMSRTHGFWYHFIDMQTGARVWSSEVSIIDTALLINGVLTAGRYFGGRVEQLAYELYEAIEWSWYFDYEANKFYMGYKPETGFEGYWGGYAEQLMVFVLAAGSPDHSVGKGAYQLMKLSSTKVSSGLDYGSFYPTWTGSLFTHQYSHAWIDFESYNDEQGYNWFTNSVNAVDAAIAYAKSQTSQYIGINENSWGMSACDGPSGYVGNYGSGPSAGNAHFVDGTVPAYGALGSIVFRPEEAIAAALNYRTYERFWSVYGFKDAYNLSNSANGWFGNDIIGLDKGISVVMIENYLSGMVWKIYMEVPYIQDGLESLDFVAVE